MGNDHIIVVVVVVVDSGNIDGRNSSPRQREWTSMALLAEDLLRLRVGHHRTYNIA